MFFAHQNGRARFGQLFRGAKTLVISYLLLVNKVSEQDYAAVDSARITELPQIKTFEDLHCWQKCRELRIFVAKEIVPALPKEERFRLGDQFLRGARSTTANIAEGYGRFHHLDNAKFCSNSRGSCWEVLDHLITSSDEGLLPTAIIEKGKALVPEAVKLLNGYMSYLKRAASNPDNR